MQRNPKLIIQLAVGLMIALGTAKAEDKRTNPAAAAKVSPPGSVAKVEDKKIDPSGNWKWNFTNQTGQIREIVLKLKLDGEKLTGTVSGTSGDAAIKEGKLKGEEVSFQVTREFNGAQYTVKYVGKISGDTIKGKTESQMGGQTQSHDWEAKREAVKAKASDSQ
jgi:hypothetical protein